MHASSVRVYSLPDMPRVWDRRAYDRASRVWCGAGTFAAGGTATIGRKKNAGGGSPAAPTYVNSGTISADSNSTNATASPSGTPNTNDILLAHITIVGSNASSITAPSGEGWSLAVRGDSSSTVTCAVYWKRWGTGSTDNTSIAFTGSAGNMRSVITRVSGCKTTGDPFVDITCVASGGDGIDDTNLIAPTASGDTNQLVMRFFSAQSTGQSITAPSTVAYHQGSGTFTAGTDGACAASYATSSSNPVGTATATISVQVDASKKACTVVLTG